MTVGHNYYLLGTHQQLIRFKTTFAIDCERPVLQSMMSSTNLNFTLNSFVEKSFSNHSGTIIHPHHIEIFQDYHHSFQNLHPSKTWLSSVGATEGVDRS